MATAQEVYGPITLTWTGGVDFANVGTSSMYLSKTYDCLQSKFAKSNRMHTI